MAADGLTTRAYFRQLRADDFARNPRQIDHVRQRVDELTAPHYAEPRFWSDYPRWVSPSEAHRRQRRSLKEM